MYAIHALLRGAIEGFVSGMHSPSPREAAGSD